MKNINSQPQKPLAILSAVGAYLWWGFVPLYWHLMSAMSASAILAYRIIFGLVFVSLLLLLRNRFGQVFTLLKNRKTFLLLLLAACLICINWGVYIWAVNSGHVIEASFGFYINPLLSVALGIVIFREKLGKVQLLALMLAALGVVVIAFEFGRPPWISLILAVSFGLYGAVKKLLSVGSLPSLAVESLLSLPLSFSLLFFSPSQADPAIIGNLGWLLVGASGIVTAIPLLLFGYASARVPLSTMGFFQYLSPTVSLLLGVFVFGESFGPGRLAGFICIWSAVLVFSVGNYRKYRELTRSYL